MSPRAHAAPYDIMTICDLLMGAEKYALVGSSRRGTPNSHTEQDPAGVKYCCNLLHHGHPGVTEVAAGEASNRSGALCRPRAQATRKDLLHLDTGPELGATTGREMRTEGQVGRTAGQILRPAPAHHTIMAGVGRVSEDPPDAGCHCPLCLWKVWEFPWTRMWFSLDVD